MSKDNTTLVEDIYGVFDQDINVTPEVAKAFGENLAGVVIGKFEKRQPYLRLSNLGSACRRRLWYSVNCAELGEKLSGAAHIKFLIGDITEAVIIFLAKLAGHAVADEQQSVTVHGVKGHLDATINGEVTDVKSASPFSFKKFKAGLKKETDAFGYLTQLGSYVQAKGGGRGNFLAVDKVLGHLHLDAHDNLPTVSAGDVQEVRQILDSPEPPPRGFEDEKAGESGNRKLGVACSYCEFKQVCWPGVARYNYAQDKVTWLTKVVREPRVEKASS